MRSIKRYVDFALDEDLDPVEVEVVFDDLPMKNQGYQYKPDVAYVLHHKVSSLVPLCENGLAVRKVMIAGDYDGSIKVPYFIPEGFEIEVKNGLALTMINHNNPLLAVNLGADDFVAAFPVSTSASEINNIDSGLKELDPCSYSRVEAHVVGPLNYPETDEIFARIFVGVVHGVFTYVFCDDFFAERSALFGELRKHFTVERVSDGSKSWLIRMPEGKTLDSYMLTDDLLEEIRTLFGGDDA